MRSGIVVAMGMLMTAILAISGWPATVSAETTDGPPKVAVIVPLSGELGPLGEQLVEAARLAARQRGVRIRAIDEGESAEEALRAVTEAAQAESVVAAIGPVSRRHTGPAASEAQRLGLPLIVFSPAHGVERRGPMIFRARLSPEEQSRRIAPYVVEELKGEKIGLLAPRTPYADRVVTTLVDSFNRQGATVTAMARYERDATDFRPALEWLTGSRAYVGQGRRMPGVDADGLVRLSRRGVVSFDTLVIADGHRAVARLLPFLPRYDIGTGASDDGTPVQLVGLEGWRGDGLQRAADHARGAVFFATFGGEVDGPAARRLTIEYREATEREVTVPEAEFHDLVAVVATAIEATVGETETARRGVVRWLRRESAYQGASGHWSFDAHGAPQRKMQGYEVFGGGRWMPRSGGAR